MSKLLSDIADNTKSETSLSRNLSAIIDATYEEMRFAYPSRMMDDKIYDVVNGVEKYIYPESTEVEVKEVKQLNDVDELNGIIKKLENENAWLWEQQASRWIEYYETVTCPTFDKKNNDWGMFNNKKKEVKKTKIRRIIDAITSVFKRNKEKQQ